MSNQWTKPQKMVIDLRNRNILVSAAAGSGKTAVLVERIIQRVTDEKHPVDIDRLLVVTFSNAAAGEMRERILAAIEQKAYEHPENQHLQKQLTYIHNAKITTIHSFCLNVIREHFNCLDIDPSFSVADEGELKLVEEDVIKELMEEYYQEKSPQFLRFIEQYSTARSDRGIEEIIRKLYRFSMSYPSPLRWLDSCISSYQVENGEDLLNMQWMRQLLDAIRSCVEGMAEKIRRCVEVAGQPDGPYMYLEAVCADEAFLEKLMGAGDYEAMTEILKSYRPVSLGREKKGHDPVSFAKKEEVKRIRDDVKKQIAVLKKNYFQTSLEEQVISMKGCLETVSVMVELTKAFAEKYRRKKMEKNVVDFNDLEHYALEVLVQTDGNGRVTPTNAADEMAMEFDEVMVDEYQDSNLVQELILSALSRERQNMPNMFMVGDVKQSIYKFRLARPELFMEKYRTFSHIEDMEEDRSAKGNGRRINLDRNFRSREEVLTPVNYVFRQIMGSRLGGVEYDEENALYPGAEYPPLPDTQVSEAELLILETKKEDMGLGDAEEKSAKELEAELVTEKIKELTETYQVYDKEKNSYRPCRYSDIVILLRSMTGTADIYAEALANAGIPAYCESQTGYFNTMEITTILNMLRIIDNPRQDIPLVSVLTSPMFGIEANELAKIRASYPKVPYYEAVGNYCKEGEDKKLTEALQGFFTLLEKYRDIAPHTSIYELITLVLDDTGYYNYVQAMPGGKRRTANIRMLKEKAVDYENGSYKGLFHYVRYIEKIKQYQLEAGEASVISENENTVRIMSIHKSKGLEFPVVFVAGMGKKLNKSDSYEKIVMHPDLGIGVDGIDPEEKLRVQTLIKKAMGKQIELEGLGEELRVLYVAFTRAREKLILTGTVANLEKSFFKWTESRFSDGEKLPYEVLIKAGCYLDMVAYALARNKAFYPLYEKFGVERPWNAPMAEENSGIRVLVYSPYDIVASSVEQRAEADRIREQLLSFDTDRVYYREWREQIGRRLDFAYPYFEAAKLPSKLTVTELKEKYLDEEVKNQGEVLYQRTEASHVPRFISGEKKLSGAARGTAFHRILELFDYALEPEENNYRQMAKEFLEKGKIDETVYHAIEYRKLVQFAGSSIGKRMKRAYEAGTLKREAKFVLGISSSLDEQEGETETVLVQGIIDAYFIEDGQVVIVDYKTDRVKDMGELKKRYQVQLDYYGRAVEQLTGRKVKEKIIYSTYLAKEENIE